MVYTGARGIFQLQRNWNIPLLTEERPTIGGICENFLRALKCPTGTDLIFFKGKDFVLRSVPSSWIFLLRYIFLDSVKENIFQELEPDNKSATKRDWKLTKECKTFLWFWPPSFLLRRCWLGIFKHNVLLVEFSVIYKFIYMYIIIFIYIYIYMLLCRRTCVLK